MKNMIARTLSLCLFAATGVTLSAANLDDFGIGSVEQMTEQQGSAVRGAGFASSESTAMSAMQVFIFDSVNGSSINLSSSSINTASDHGDLSDSDAVAFVASATQSASSLTAMDFAIGDFQFTTSEFAIGSFGDSASAGPSILFDPLP